MNETFTSLLVFLVVIWPLGLAGAMAFSITRSMALRLAPWAALPALLLTTIPLQGYLFHFSWLLFGTEMGLAGESDRLFLLFTALLWWLSGMYARAHLSDQPGRGRFFIYFLLSMTGNLGLILAQDLTCFYLFFALMSFASYGLVVHKRSDEALRAGRIYIILVVMGEIALFSAMVLSAFAAGATEFDSVRQALVTAQSRDLIIFLALLGFGIKAGVLGLHVWLPLAHPVAPVPASAVLSGAMIKAGLLGWLRLFPLGSATLLSWGKVFILLGLVATFYGVVVGLTQRDAKTLLAYSSISQMGILTMAVGVGLSTPGAYPTILTIISFYALHHGLSKGALFLGVGVINACNAAVQRRWVWLALWLPALALAGAPLTGGMAVKFFLKKQIVSAPGLWGPALQTLLPWSAVATALLVGRFLFLLYQPKPEPSDQPLSAGLIWPWALLVVTAVVLPWWLIPKSSSLWSQAAILGSLWPVLPGAGLTLTAVFWRANLAGYLGKLLMGRQVSSGPLMPHIPPGDVLVCITRCMNPLFSYGRRLANEQLPRWRDDRLAPLRRSWSHVDWWRSIERIESRLNHWSTALVILTLLGLITAAVAASK